MVADESWALDDIKFHGGFMKRSKLCIGNEKQGILAKIDDYKPKPNRVILTGHSLGAAVSALVYIQLSKKQANLYIPSNIKTQINQLETDQQNLRLINGRFTTLCSQFFANYMSVFHKTEGSDGHFQVPNVSNSYLVQKF